VWKRSGKHEAVKIERLAREGPGKDPGEREV